MQMFINWYIDILLKISSKFGKISSYFYMKHVNVLHKKQIKDGIRDE